MSIVIDASMTMTWYFKDEATPVSAAILEFVVEFGAIVPSLWRIEVANALKVGIRRKRINSPFRSRTLATLSAMPIIIDGECDRHIWTRTLELSDQYGLTIYDACYLGLADRNNMPLATFDRELIATARAHGMPVLAL
jgi:predicted nucleic acid-binding protein